MNGTRAAMRALDTHRLPRRVAVLPSKVTAFTTAPALAVNPFARQAPPRYLASQRNTPRKAVIAL